MRNGPAGPEKNEKTPHWLMAPQARQSGLLTRLVFVGAHPERPGQCLLARLDVRRHRDHELSPAAVGLGRGVDDLNGHPRILAPTLEVDPPELPWKVQIVLVLVDQLGVGGLGKRSSPIRSIMMRRISALSSVMMSSDVMVSGRMMIFSVTLTPCQTYRPQSSV